MLRLRRRQGRARFLAMRRGGAALVPLTPPVLTWTSGTATYNPTFNLTQIALSYKTRLRIVSIDGVADGTIYTDSDTVSLSEATFGTLSVDTFPTLAYSKAYVIDGAYSPDGGAPWSPWSNTVSKTMAAAPTQFIIDPLNGTTNALVPGNAAPTGGTWTQYPGLGGVISYDGTGGIFGGGGANAMYNTFTPANANYYVEAVLTFLSADSPGTDDEGFALLGRASASSFDWYFAIWAPHSSTWILRKIVGGSWTTLGTFADTFTSGTKTPRLSMNGNQISLSVNGSVVIGPITDTTFAGAGKVGVWGYINQTATTGIHVSNIEAGYL